MLPDLVMSLIRHEEKCYGRNRIKLLYIHFDNSILIVFLGNCRQNPRLLVLVVLIASFLCECVAELQR